MPNIFSTKRRRLSAALLVVVAAVSLFLLIGGRGGEAQTAGPVLDPLLNELQERTFRYFWETGNPQNGLIPDRYPTPSYASIAAVGFGLTTYPVGVDWKSPPREDAETTWGEAIRRHGLHTVLGAGWGAGMFWLAPSYAWWFMPVVGALALSIPISVYSSRISLGRALRRAQVFLIPEEADPPRELASVGVRAAAAEPAPSFVDAVVDPAINAIACAAAPPHARSGLAAQSRRHLIAVALGHGPAALTDGQKRLLLADRVALSELHHRVWTAAAHPAWRAGIAPEPLEIAALSVAS